MNHEKRFAWRRNWVVVVVVMMMHSTLNHSDRFLLCMTSSRSAFGKTHRQAFCWSQRKNWKTSTVGWLRPSGSCQPKRSIALEKLVDGYWHRISKGTSEGLAPAMRTADPAIMMRLKLYPYVRRTKSVRARMKPAMRETMQSRHNIALKASSLGIVSVEWKQVCEQHVRKMRPLLEWRM